MGLRLGIGILIIILGVVCVALAIEQKLGWRRIALVVSLVVGSVALQTIGPSPGVGPLLASAMIVWSTSVPRHLFNRWLHRLLTLLPVVGYVGTALVLNWTLNQGRSYGAPQLYMVVATVIPTLLIALSLTGRVFSKRPRVFYETALSLFVLYAMSEGEFHALRAVYHQRGDKDDFALAISGLAAGFLTVVFAAVLDEAALAGGANGGTPLTTAHAP